MRVCVSKLGHCCVCVCVNCRTARVHHIEASSVTVFGALKPAPFMLQSQDSIRLVDTCFDAAFFRLTDIAASQFSQHV